MEALEYHTLKAMADPVELQLQAAAFCASSTCGVRSEHLNYKKHSMIRLLYRFHMYYHMRQVLKRLQVPLPYESRFNAANNLYSGEGFFKLCKDYGAPHDPMRY